MAKTAAPKPTVDEWVAQHVEPDLLPIVDGLRALLRTLAPTAREEVGYNMPMYHGRHVPLAYITAARHHITLSFTVGVNFDDKYGQLRGSAKHARYLRFKSVDDINETHLRYYIRQAIKHDRR